MTPLPRECVIDASVTIKLFLPELHSGVVLAYFERPDIQIYAPDLLPTECTNILWKAVQFNKYNRHQAVFDLQDLLKLPILFTLTQLLLPRALELSLAHGIAVYDACYLALAETLRLPFLTEDARLAAKVGRFAIPILVLSTLVTPSA